MAMATMKLTIKWDFRTRYACVDALYVAQGRIMPFFEKNADIKLKIT